MKNKTITKLSSSTIEENVWYALKNSKGQYLSIESEGKKDRWTKDIMKAFISKANTELYWEPKPSQKIVQIVDETIRTRKETFELLPKDWGKVNGKKF